jgi:hypothetical protein
MEDETMLSNSIQTSNTTVVLESGIARDDF